MILDMGLPTPSGSRDTAFGCTRWLPSSRMTCCSYSVITGDTCLIRFSIAEGLDLACETKLIRCRERAIGPEPGVGVTHAVQSGTVVIVLTINPDQVIIGSALRWNAPDTPDQASQLARLNQLA